MKLKRNYFILNRRYKINNKCLVLLINLKRRPDRLGEMIERLKGLDFTLIEAIDGNNNDLLENLEYNKNLSKYETSYIPCFFDIFIIF